MTQKIPFSPAVSEFVEKRSRFIGQVWPVSSEEEARDCIRAAKKKYHDARHNCWCYIIGENVLRYSDDGEPQGTAGQPMLNVFQREGVGNVCCVVTRYFGGILLGAGGLTRAYGKAARDALSAAGISVMSLWEQVQLDCEYSLLERVKLEIAAQGGLLDDVAYAAGVTVTASLPDGTRDKLQQRLTELSAGGIALHSLGQSLRPGPRVEV